MSHTYTVTLTDAEHKAFEYAAIVDYWIENAVKERARVATDEIVEIVVKNCLSFGMNIPNTKEDMIDLAYSEGWIKTAVERNTINGQ